MSTVQEETKGPYQLLPFRFRREKDGTVFLTNDVGEFVTLSSIEFDSFVGHQLDPKAEVFQDLAGKHFAANGDVDLAIELLATKLRTKKRFLDDFTSLHMVVPTIACNSQCVYCQVSSRPPDERGYSMSEATVEKVVDTIFRTRSSSIKIEFQGGEPLLRFDLVKKVVADAEKANRHADKDLSFVLCSNLTLLSADHLSFLKDHDVLVSTSLDGPQGLHDANRLLRDGTGSYEVVARNLDAARTALGNSRVSALMTVTANNLFRLPEVVEEYRRRGLASIFIRPLNPYGAAHRHGLARTYTVEQFVSEYLKALDAIIAINLSGSYFVEEYAALLLERILTPFGSGFVDLQSPSGCAISGVIYNYDGNVYVSDEGRMLAEMGDRRFFMGNVHHDAYEKMFMGTVVEELVRSSIIETLPGCSTCVYCPYCGTDPVRNYSEHGDIVGNRFPSESCRKNMAIFDQLFGILRYGDPAVKDVLWSWVTRRPLAKVSLTS